MGKPDAEPPRPRGKRMGKGALLRSYIAATALIAPFAPRLLKARADKGREDPARIAEKLGRPSGWRPANTRLVWMHAVGLGEVMALRGLISEMHALTPDLQVLVTSSARSSAQVFAQNCPPQTQHQFLPLDATRFIGPFLDYWKPDLSIWAEQDIWPNLIVQTHDRGIPLALVNARIGAASFAKRRRVGGLYRDLFKRFSLISAQDPDSAAHIEQLGAPKPVQVHPSLKLIAPALSADPAALRALRGAIGDRRVWMVGPSHGAGEALALEAHRKILADDPSALLILVPRALERRDEIAAAARTLCVRTALRSTNTLPDASDQVFIADTFGEMGLWYRLASTALIGGSFNDVEGHNPWEAARLGAAILHGPRIENFRADYARLHSFRAATQVTSADEIVEALRTDLGPQVARAAACCAENGAALGDLARQLTDLLPGSGA